MINILPDEHKDQIFYARRNTILKNWVLASCVGVLGIVLVVFAGQIFISRSTSSAQRQVDDLTKQLSAQKQEEVQKRITDISESVRLALDVLSRQVLFSKLLTQVGAAMPPGTTLKSLSINAPQGGIDLVATARDQQHATQIQINLSDPANKVFEKADIVSVTCENDKDTGKTVKCDVAIRALFAKDNAFQYIPSKTGATQ